MKGIIFFMAFLPAALQAQEYNVEQRCSGNGVYAMVVEYADQYHVVETPQYFQHDWTISDLRGIRTGGFRTMNFMNGDGVKGQMEVKIISRGEWGYSGSAGAKAMCRRVTQPGFMSRSF